MKPLLTIEKRYLKKILFVKSMQSFQLKGLRLLRTSKLATIDKT